MSTRWLRRKWRSVTAFVWRTVCQIWNRMQYSGSSSTKKRKWRLCQWSKLLLTTATVVLGRQYLTWGKWKSLYRFGVWTLKARQWTCGSSSQRILTRFQTLGISHLLFANSSGSGRLRTTKALHLKRLRVQLSTWPWSNREAQENYL